MAPRFLENLVNGITGASGLDPVARPLSKQVGAIIPQGAVKDALSGTWMGHPLHPLLTDVTIGAWTSAFLLDLLGRGEDELASARLVGLGVVSALPTAVSGLADWSDLLGEERRLGLVHALANVVAISLYGSSWVARRKGDQRRGVALGLAGATAATFGGYLGGHLAYRKGVNVNRHAWDHPTSEGWEDAAAESDLQDGQPIAVSVGGEEVLVVRTNGQVYAIADVCAHAGGPLHEGEIDGICVTCPWHGSVFRLDDGHVVHGPATAPQPAYDVRLTGGRVSLRRR
jgi:nitrite reductase/ring-hydroxylating ferredoxin subunit/uncharacterized membrane protein